MIWRHRYLVPACLFLAACHPAARTRVMMLADSDPRPVRSAQPAATPLAEAPLFRIDPAGPPAAMAADAERRESLPPAPRPVTEPRQPR